MKVGTHAPKVVVFDEKYIFFMISCGNADFVTLCRALIVVFEGVKKLLLRFCCQGRASTTVVFTSTCSNVFPGNTPEDIWTRRCPSFSANRLILHI